MTHGDVDPHTVDGVASIIRTSDTKYSGSTCSDVSPPNRKEKPLDGDDREACTPATDGQTVCIKDNGDFCASASTRALFCWTPGATGEKVNGDSLQITSSGASPGPSSPPPPGEQWHASSSSNVTNNSSSTNIYNYNTTSTTGGGGDTSGGDTGGGDTGGGDTGTDPDGDGDTASDSDCSAPPSCISTDPVKCATLLQQWRTTCATELAAGKASVLSNLLCNTDGVPEGPLNCAGMTPQNCYLAFHARKQACAAESMETEIKKLTATIEVPDPGDGTGETTGPSVDDVWQEAGQGEEPPEVDSDGWIPGGRACPIPGNVQVMGIHIPYGEKICGFMEITGVLVMLFAAWKSAQIIAHGAVM